MFARRVSSQGLCPNIQGPKGLDWVICLVVLVAALAAIGPAVRPSWAGEKQWQTQHSKHQSDNTRSHYDANPVMYRNICVSWLGYLSQPWSARLLQCPTKGENPVSVWTCCPFVGHLPCSFSTLSCDRTSYFIRCPQAFLKTPLLQEAPV